MTSISRDYNVPSADDPAVRLRAALSGGRVEEGADILLAHLRGLLADHRELVSEAIQSLPEEVIAARPGLVIARGFGIGSLQPSGALNVAARRAEPDLDPFGLDEEELDAYFFQRMVSHRLRAEFADARDVAARLRARVYRTDALGHRPVHDMVAFYLLHMGMVELLAGGFAQALRDLEDALTLHGRAGPDFTQRDAAAKAACIQAAEGRLHEAERLLARCEEYPLPSGPLSTRVSGSELLAQTLVAVERLDASAEGLLRRVDDELVDDELWPLALLAWSRWLVATGASALALDRIDRARSSKPLPAGSLAEAVAVAMRAQALIMLGEAEAACDELPPAGGPVVLGELAVARVRSSLFVDPPATVLRLARNLLARDGLPPVGQAEVLLVATWAHQLLAGIPDDTRASAAVRLIEEEGIRRVLLLVPERLRAALPLSRVSLPTAAFAMPEPNGSVRLTKREGDVLELLVDRGTVAEIADVLGLSVNTVKTQISSLYRRLGVHSRQEAITAAMRLGLIESP